MTRTIRYTIFFGNAYAEQVAKTFPQEEYELAMAHAQRLAELYSAMYDKTQTACDHWYSEDSGVYVEIRMEAC